MKKISNFFKSFLNLIDKYIVVPITKLVLLITGKINKSSKTFENLLTKPSTLLFLSLFIAIIIFIVVDQRIISFSTNSAEVFKDQPVNVIYNEEAYVVEGLPETVDITLIGSKADLYIAKQSSTHNVTVDLTGLGPGTHRVAIEYDEGISDIEYSVNPSMANVTIYEKVSDTKSLTYDILNENKLKDTLVIDDVKLSVDEVTVRGAEYKVNQVSVVKALIDIDDLSSQSVGTQTIENVELRAYDKNGNVLDVEFVPETIKAELKIASPSKEVTLNFVPDGEMPFGKAISSYSFSKSKIVVYGDKDKLSNLESIDIKVDVSNLTKDEKIKIEIPKPSGVVSMDTNYITANISVTDVSSKPAEFNVSLTGINLSEGLVAQPVGEDNSVISIKVQGAKNVIDSIKAEDITAFVDLEGYKEGTYDVEVQVTGTNPLAIYISGKSKAKIKIVKSR